MNAAEGPQAPPPDTLRLLPWTTPEGKPCHLSADSDNSRLSLLADDVEDAQLGSGEQVLVGARAVLADAGAGEHAVRFALTRAVESLSDVPRIAVSRGRRMPGSGFRAGLTVGHPPGCARRARGREGVHGEHMNTTSRPQKTVSRIPRVFAVSAALSIACAAGLATATSAVAATPATHVAAKATPAYGHGGGGDGYGDVNKCGNGILDLLNFCN